MTCRRRGFLAVFLGLALSSCTQLASRQPVAGTPVVEAPEDSSQRFIGLIGPKAQHAPRFLDIPETNFYCLRSFVDRRTGETAHQLYVTDSYFGAERGWNAARDSAGASLPFVAIGRDEISCDAGCSYVEEFAANLPESALRGSPDGLAVTFSSRSGDEKTIVVSGERITAQLAAIDARRTLAQAGAARAPPIAAERSAAHQSGYP
jgi:hypothetical protein